MEGDVPIIRSLQRGIDILNSFTKDKQQMTLTEIAKDVNLTKSTTSRLLHTLEHNDFIEKDASTSKYRLGRQAYFIGHSASASMELKTIAEPVMKRLRDQTNETVNLYIRDDDARVCIQQFESRQSVRHMIKIGQQLPLSVGAGGKMLLSAEASSYQQKVIAAEALAEEQNLKEELALIKQLNYSVSIDERETGTAAASAGIYNRSGKLLAALSVSGPSQRFHPENDGKLKDTIQKSAEEISVRLGYKKIETQHKALFEEEEHIK